MAAGTTLILVNWQASYPALVSSEESIIDMQTLRPIDFQTVSIATNVLLLVGQDTKI